MADPQVDNPADPPHAPAVGTVPGPDRGRVGGRHRVPAPPAAAVETRRKVPVWMFVAPSMLVLAVIILYPLGRAVWMSLHGDSKRLDPETGRFVTGGFVGIENYTRWITQTCNTATGSIPCPPGTLGSQFWQSIFNTFFFTVVTVSLETVIGFAMAVVMAKSFRGRGLLRASVLVPWAIPTAVTAKLWFFIFANDGAANKLLGTDYLWTADPWPARFAIIVADVWKTAPFMALLILAGLQMIPQDVYEAAKVDGARSWGIFRLIKLPLLLVTVAPLLIASFAFNFNNFNLIYMLTNGGPRDSSASINVGHTDILISMVYKVAFTGQNRDYGLASAFTILIFIIVAVISIISFRRTKALEELN